MPWGPARLGELWRLHQMSPSPELLDWVTVTFSQELSPRRMAAHSSTYRLFRDMRWDGAGRGRGEGIRLHAAFCISLLHPLSSTSPRSVMFLPRGFFPRQKARAAWSQRLFLSFVKT